MCCILGFQSTRYTEAQIRPYFDRTKSRGPDDTRYLTCGDTLLAFHRLAIMGLHDEGMQPFVRGENAVVCNGELYGWRSQRKALEAKGYSFQSDSDCELLPLQELCADIRGVPDGGKKRIDELHMYDVILADRCISVNSLAARVTFGDLDFVRYVIMII